MNLGAHGTEVGTSNIERQLHFVRGHDLGEIRSRRRDRLTVDKVLSPLETLGLHLLGLCLSLGLHHENTGRKEKKGKSVNQCVLSAHHRPEALE